MELCQVAVYGCGTVGLGVCRILLSPGPLHERTGDSIRLKYVVDGRTEELAAELPKDRGVILTDDLEAPLRDPEVGVVVELFGGTTTARTVIEKALAAGKDVVTANKALLAEHGDELFRFARAHGRSIAFEASVAGGIPVIGSIRRGLISDPIESIYGIVNGTCNYVLTEMDERGLSYEDAVAEAQRRGYAEADPRLDVEGVDSAHKLAVLVRLAFGVRVRLEDIPCEGISGVDRRDIEYARGLGYTLKLLAVAVRRDERLELSVYPALLHRDHPVAVTGGVYNAICIHAGHAGELVMTGMGAGRLPTASAVVSDIAAIALGKYPMHFSRLSQFGDVPAADLVPQAEFVKRFYLCMECVDSPGALGKVATILGEEGISIASVHQQEVGEGLEAAPVVFMTHKACEGAVDRALDRISRLSIVPGGRPRMLRVEDV
ncbi:MAG: homoserine dehydrogenase [Candidatus Brocadiaceae bacterium]|nr:homoserine dehydrogenase [Candidatus Brocadiaceae bacterium]